MKSLPHNGGLGSALRGHRLATRHLITQILRWTLAGAIMALMGFMTCFASGQSLAGPRRPRFDPTKPNTSPEARQSAIASIPFEKLPPESRKKVASVLSKPTIFRRMPLHVTECDPNLHQFIVRHPDVLVGIWEELGVSGFRMAETSPGLYQATDGKSTKGTAEFVYQSDDTYVVYCKGTYQGPPLAKPLTGTALLVLKTGNVRHPDGHTYITTRLDTFTHIDNVTVDFLTRTFQPLIGHVVDNNFLQTSEFVGSLSRTTAINHRGIQRLAGRLHRVRPEVRKEFAALARQLGEKGATRQVSHETPLGAAIQTRMTAKPNTGRY